MTKFTRRGKRPNLWKDDNDRFYFIDREQAVVRVGRLKELR